MESNFIETLRNMTRQNLTYRIYPGRDATGLNFLQVLVFHSDQEVVKNYLVKNINKFKNEIDHKNELGATALMMACSNWGNNSNVIVNLLLKAGANVNEKDEFGNTPLICACLYSSDIEPIKLLLNCKNIDINIQSDDDEFSALMWASLNSKKHDTETVKLLLEKGANPDLQCGGVTALSLCYNSIDILKMLLEKGANVNIKDVYGKTPLMLAFEYEDIDEKFTLEKLKLLLKYGADINAKDDNGFTPLMYSCSTTPFPEYLQREKDLKELKFVKFLLSIKKIDVNAQNNFGRTALMTACYEGSSDFNDKIIKLLLSRDDIDVELKDYSAKKSTALSLFYSENGEDKEFAKSLGFKI